MIYATPQKENSVSELQFAIKVAKEVKWYRRLKVVQIQTILSSESE
jgi:hypothetical protein